MSQRLFNHMSEQYGLTLLQTDMDEIKRIVREEDEADMKVAKKNGVDDFIEAFNNVKRYMHQTRGYRFTPVRSVSKPSQLNARLKEYSMDELKKVILAAFKDNYHVDTKWKYVTTEYVTRPQTIEKYL